MTKEAESERETKRQRERDRDRWWGDAQCEGPKGASKTPSVRFILT